MPSKKNIARFPTILAEYDKAVNGVIDPQVRELFLDVYGKDIYYYSPAGEFVSLITLIKAGLVDTWLPPCVSLKAIKATYPNPDLSTVCAATDTGIIYEYVGDGNWIPVSINALQLASEKNDGLMSIELYNAVREFMNGCKEVYIEKNEPIPAPFKRKNNYYYNIYRGQSSSLNEREWVDLEPVPSIPTTIDPNWPYDRMFLIVKDKNDEDNGKIYEEKDPLYHVVLSQSLVKEEKVPEGHSDVFFLLQPSKLVEVVIPTEYIAGSYEDDWPYFQGYYIDENKKRYKITDPGYIVVRDPTEVVQVPSLHGVSDVFYDVLKDARGIQIETVIPTPTKESAYPSNWPYANGFYTSKSGELMKIIDPGYIEVNSPSDVRKVDPECDVKDVFFDILKSTK